MSKASSIKSSLYEHFCRYVSIASQSDAKATTLPSSEGQHTLALMLKEELEHLALMNIEIDDNAIVTALLPSNSDKDFDRIGFIAHLDTVDIDLSPKIKPQLIKNYSGGDICLHAERNIVLSIREHPEILDYVGDDIILTDGTSVLGADNKAAIASIMVGIKEIIASGQEHGDIYLCFVPDEEIGLRGVKHLDLSRFPVDYAYTIDCCSLGELVYQTFNAATASISIKGVAAHPMSAKGVLVNPTLIAVDIINQLDRLQTPENTEHTQGYIWASEMHSNQSNAQLYLNIRDHDKKRFTERKSYIEQVVATVAMKHPRASIELSIEDTYYNINDAVTEHNKKAIDNLFRAMHHLNITPKVIAMRGGTDGSYLSSQGILTPNFFTGACNFHSHCEFLPMHSFYLSYAMLIELTTLARKNNCDNKLIS